MECNRGFLERKIKNGKEAFFSREHALFRHFHASLPEISPPPHFSSVRLAKGAAEGGGAVMKLGKKERKTTMMSPWAEEREGEEGGRRKLLPSFPLSGRKRRKLKGRGKISDLGSGEGGGRRGKFSSGPTLRYESRRIYVHDMTTCPRSPHSRHWNIAP